MSNKFDTSQAPYKIPRSIVAGDYVVWRNSSYVADYPVASYTFRYNFRSEGEPARGFNVASSVDNDEFLFELDATTTGDDDFAVGLYFWDLYVIQISDSKRITLDTGMLGVMRDKADDSADPRSHPRKMLAHVNRALLHRAENNQLDTTDYSFGVESAASRDIMSLYKQRDYWREQLRLANNRWRSLRGLPHSGITRVKI